MRDRPRRGSWLLRAPATAFIAVLTMAAFVVCWVLSMVAPQVGHELELWLWNRPNFVTDRLWLWQVVTANLVHEGVLHIAVNLFFVLWLGPPLERILGSWRFASFYVGAGIFAYAVYDLGAEANLLPSWGQTAGASGCVLAIATLYALHFPKRTIRFYGVLRVPFWFILSVFVVSDISSLLWHDGIPWINNTVHLGGVAFGTAFWGVSYCLARPPALQDKASENSANQEHSSDNGERRDCPF